MIYPDGSRYEGTWNIGQRQGMGTYFYTNGDTYEGEWKEGRRHGHGNYTYNEQGLQYRGSHNLIVAVLFNTNSRSWSFCPINISLLFFQARFNHKFIRV